jgi:hypothetical protein
MNIFPALASLFSGVFLLTALSGCVSGGDERDTMPGSFQMDDGAGFDFVWEKCALKDGRGCVNGTFNDQAYSLGFTAEGKKLAGSLGAGSVEFMLDESDVGALGRDVYELKFVTEKKDMLATVTWNARKGKVIGHELVQTD